MDRLAEIFGKENVLKDEPMSRHTTFRIGGAADFFVKVQTISQLQEAMRYLKKEQIPFYIVGNGSNLLVRDEGVRGVVLQLGERFSGYEFLHETPGSVAQSGTAVDKNQIVMVRAKAGSLLGRLGKEFAEYSLSGFEFASGIPGTLGGAVYMNAVRIPQKHCGREKLYCTGSRSGAARIIERRSACKNGRAFCTAQIKTAAGISERRKYV